MQISPQVVIVDELRRKRAIDMVAMCPVGYRVLFKEPKRSTEQSDKMWAMLSDIADQISLHGIRLTAEDWKLVFMDALKRELRVVTNLDGNGIVNLGNRTSKLSKSEMADLITLIQMHGDTHGVIFGNDVKRPKID